MLPELQLQGRERKPKATEKAGMITDHIISAREGTFLISTGIIECLKCGVLPGHCALLQKHNKKEGNILQGSRKGWKRGENRKLEKCCFYATATGCQFHFRLTLLVALIRRRASVPTTKKRFCRCH